VNIKGRKIYLDPKADGIEYEPSEWRLCEAPAHCVTHLPTWTIFQIRLNEEARAKGKATLDDFFAVVVHVCRGQYRPTDDVLEFLGRGAIAVYLQAIGAWKPEVTRTPDTARHKTIKSSYPRPN